MILEGDKFIQLWFINYYYDQKLTLMNLFRALIKPNQYTNLLRSVSLTTQPKTYFAQTSRSIEHKMREQRNKNLHNKFKSLQSHFGLNKPKTVSPNFPKPSTYQYSIQSLRKNSHMYPDYLLSELSNDKSQYYQVIEGLFDSLSNTDNKESIQFLQFMVNWKIYTHSPEYQEVLTRKIYQMNLNLAELFRLLKAVVSIEQPQIRNTIMVNLQNKMLDKILNIDHFEYESLFKILNFMRIHDLCPKVKSQIAKNVLGQQSKEVNEQSFFKIVEKVLLKNLDQIPLPNLAEMIVHYGNNIKENYDDKIEILSKVEGKVLQHFAFFTHDQLIAIMYSYLKTQAQSDKLVEEFVKRMELLYFQISWENKRKLLGLASSLPYNKWLFIVGLSIHQVLKGKKLILREGKVQNDPSLKQVEYQLLPAIYLASYETNLMTAQLIEKLQSKILQNIFNYKSQDVGLIAWLFTITPPSMSPHRQNRDLLYTKIQSIITGGFNGSTFTLKDLSMVVWSLCNYGGKSNQIYKENADFWNNIEYYIQQRISNKKQQRLLNGCCQILWSYLNNKSLTIKTINMITDVIIQAEKEGILKDQMFNFQLVMITSFYYSLKDSLPKPIVTFIYNLCIKYFKILLPQMDYLQIMKIIKFIINNQQDQLKPQLLEKQIWSQIIEQFYLDIQKIQYPYIMGVVGYTIISPQGRATQAKAVEIVTKLMQKKKRLQQLKPINSKPT